VSNPFSTFKVNNNDPLITTATIGGILGVSAILLAKKKLPISE
jgi:hypothetical protein